MKKYLFKIETRQAEFLNDGRDAEYGPRYFNDRTYEIEATTEKQAIKEAERLYGHKQDEHNGNDWVEMYVVSATPPKESNKS